MKLNFVIKKNMMDFMKKADRKIFFAGIRSVMKDNKITQSVFADAIGCDQTTISNYINLKTRPQDEHYDVFLEIVKMSKDEVMNIGRQSLNEFSYTTQKTTEGTSHMHLNQLFDMISEIESEDPDNLDTVFLIVDNLYKKIKKRDPGKKVG